MFYKSDEEDDSDENSDENSDAEASDEEVSNDDSDESSAVSEDEDFQDAPVTDESDEDRLRLENMSRGKVRRFVLNLYKEVCAVDYAALGAENEFGDEFFIKCMTHACQEAVLGEDFSIRTVDILNVRGVVMRMVRRHKGAGLTFEPWHYRTMEMQRAVKWQHEDDAASEDGTLVEDGPLSQTRVPIQHYLAEERAKEAAALRFLAAAKARLAVWQPERSL